MANITVNTSHNFPLSLALVTKGREFMLYNLDKQQDVNALFQIKQVGLYSIRTLYLVSPTSEQNAAYISEDYAWKFIIHCQSPDKLDVIDWMYIGPNNAEFINLEIRPQWV